MVPDEQTGLPSAFSTIPGSQVGLLMVLGRASDGAAVLGVQGIGPVDANGGSEILFQVAFGLGATSRPADTAGYSIGWTKTGAWSGMVIKNDPGQDLIWVAFLCLISGLLLTFYFPRRRVWARFGEGRVQLAMLAERYVDAPARVQPPARRALGARRPAASLHASAPGRQRPRGEGRPLGQGRPRRPDWASGGRRSVNGSTGGWRRRPGLLPDPADRWTHRSGAGWRRPGGGLTPELAQGPPSNESAGGAVPRGPLGRTFGARGTNSPRRTLAGRDSGGRRRPELFDPVEQ